MRVIGTRDGLPANQPAVCPQQPSLLETGETTKDAQGMSGQDTDTPRVRGPLRSEPSRSDPSHTAPYSWSFKLPASLSACCLASLTTALAATSKPSPTRPDHLLHGSMFPITPDTYPQNTTLQAPHPTRTAVHLGSAVDCSERDSVVAAKHRSV